MFRLDDTFLQEIGLGNLPTEQKEAFLAHFREEMEMRVGTRLSEGLTDEQFDEFGAFIDRNMEVVDAWLARTVPDYQNDPIYIDMTKKIADSVPPEVLRSEYASLKWLSIVRPDHQKVVGEVVAQLKEETMKHRDDILNGMSQE